MHFAEFSLIPSVNGQNFVRDTPKRDLRTCTGHIVDSGSQIVVQPVTKNREEIPYAPSQTCGRRVSELQILSSSAAHGDAGSLAKDRPAGYHRAMRI